MEQHHITWRGIALEIRTLKTCEVVHVRITTEMRRAWAGWKEMLHVRGVTEVKMAVCNRDRGKMHKRTLSKQMTVAYTFAGFEASQRTHALRYTACACGPASLRTADKWRSAAPD